MNENEEYYELEDDVEYYENVSSRALTGNLYWDDSTEHNYNYFNTYN